MRLEIEALKRELHTQLEQLSQGQQALGSQLERTAQFDLASLYQNTIYMTSPNMSASKIDMLHNGPPIGSFAPQAVRNL